MSRGAARASIRASSCSVGAEVTSSGEACDGLSSVSLGPNCQFLSGVKNSTGSNRVQGHRVLWGLLPYGCLKYIIILMQSMNNKWMLEYDDTEGHL